jgi:magnesium chelatase subunit D
MELVKRNLSFEAKPEEFRESWETEQVELREQIVKAQSLLSQVTLPEANLRAIALACDALEVDGVRPDIVISKAAITHAAFEGRTEVSLEDMKLAAQLALSHRTRRGGLLEPPSANEIDDAIVKALAVAQKQDRRKSPTESATESSGSGGPRYSGGKFGRQDQILERHEKEAKKKSQRK